MSRAIILPTPGDPFLISYWLKHYAANLQKLDAQLYVAVSWPQTDETLERIRDDVERAGGRLVADWPRSHRYDHGDALGWLIDEVQETYTLLAEDDWYVRNGDAIARFFELVEHGETDIVGSPRANGSGEIAAAMLNQRQGLWPHLLITRTRYLQAVTQPWGSVSWQKGDRVIGLDHVCRDTVTSDTAIAATLELRHGKRVLEVSSPASTERGARSWFHVGSLSSGPHLRGASLSEVAPGWAARIAWWSRCYAAWPGGLDKQHVLYGQQIETLAERAGPDAVRACAALHETLVNW